MKQILLSLFILTSCTLYGQQTIDLGQDVMGTFESENIECYELTIEEPGEYILTYNLWDATISLLNADEQELFSDYMATFEASPKEEHITFQNTGTYQLCFSRGGETSMYQCRIVKNDNTDPDEAIPLEYGEYIIKELSVDGSAVTYSFNGNESNKIRIGITMIFGVSVTLTSPSDNVVYDQSYEIPPSDGLKLEFDLEETGEYLITITPLSTYLQFTLSLHLLEPVQASDIQLNEPYGGTLGNFGVDYYQFNALAGYNLLLSFAGSTAGITVQVITPGNETIICNGTIDEVHIAHALNITEDGLYLIIISADLQGINAYGLTVGIIPENYLPGTLIIKELTPEYKDVYSFSASQNDILRIGLDLPSKVVELKDPDGDIIFSLYDNESENIETDIFEEITLESDGEYIITLWHAYTEASPVEMKFCASIVPQTFIMEKDNPYSITVPPYQRLPFAFNADAGEMVSLGFPSASVMLTPGGDNISFSFGEAFLLPETGTYSINLFNYSTEPDELEIWVNNEIPPTEIPFNTYTDFVVSGIYSCTVPDGLDQLFVIMKKNNCIGYDATWYGDVTLEYSDQNWQSMMEERPDRDDYIFQLQQPDPGLYLLPVFAEAIDEEARGSILFTGQLPAAQINAWSSGVINRPYGSDWKTVDVEELADTLFFETEGFGLWSSLYVSFDQINNPEQNWIFENSGQGYNIEGKIINAPAGRYYIRYIDSAVLQDSDEGFYNHSEDQSRTYMLYVGSAWTDNSGLLTLRDVSAHELGTGLASITLSGSGLSSVSSVSLVSEDGHSTISMDIQNVTDDGRELIAGYDFSDVEPGTFQLKIQSADTLINYSKNIEILPATPATISGSMLTSDLYRLGRQQQCIITIKNSGTNDIPYAMGYFYTTSDQVGILVTDTPPSEYPADSVNTVLQEEVYNKMPFFIENMKVGEEIYLIFKIYSSTFPGNESFQVGFVVGAVDEADYYSVRSDMATDLYNLMVTSDAITESMKWYLGELTLDRFVDACNGQDDGELKKSTYDYNTNKGTVVLATDLTMSWLSLGAGKALPFSDNFSDFSETFTIMTNPWSAVQKIVKETRDAFIEACDKMQEVLKMLNNLSREKSKTAVNSTTPEDKYGPVGYGMESGSVYIDSLNLFEYRIDYWNKEDATAPAAIVYIRDTIDTDFDLQTLRFTEIGFLKWKLKLDGGQYFNVNVDCRPDMPYIVNVEANVDYKSREVFWVHTTLDPLTMDLPDDPMAGYLPPIDPTGYQIGWANYTIRPDGEMKHGVSFENQAFVNFDGVGVWGPAPPYGPYTNIFDFVSPTSYVETLDPVQNGLAFDIHLKGEDQGSGVGQFDIYVSKDYGPIYLWKTTEDLSVTFTGEDGSHYEFYSIATDKVGNTEDIKSLFDTYTDIDLAPIGVEKNSEDFLKTMKIIPNPNNGMFKIDISGSQLTGSLEIIDLTGSKIFKTEYQTGEYLNLDQLTKGLYLLRFKCDNKYYYAKLNIY